MNELKIYTAEQISAALEKAAEKIRTARDGDYYYRREPIEEKAREIAADALDELRWALEATDE